MSTTTLPAGVKKTSNYRADGGLTAMHVKILGTLSKGKPLTVAALAKAVGTSHPKLVRWALGKIDPDGRDPLALMSRGLVRQTGVDVDGKTDHVYAITKQGTAALNKIGKESAGKAKAGTAGKGKAKAPKASANGHAS